MGMLARIQIKSVRAPAVPEDGLRILVDRLWPRGISKERARVDLWLKEVAPSTELRRWFGHAPERWDEFCRRYAEELRANSQPVAELRALAAAQPVTLLFAAHDQAHNHAVALREVLLGRSPQG